MKNHRELWLEADWDSENSNFKSVIYYTSGKFKDGYSGKIGHPEPANHLVQWQRWVLRLYKKGYLNPNISLENGMVDRISFNLKGETGDYSLHYITLFEDHSSYNKDLYTDELGIWVSLFYSLIDKGIDPCSKLNVSSKKVTSVPPDVNNPEFIRKHDLRKHCIRLCKRCLHPIGFIENYYRSYVAKWLVVETQSDEAFLRNLKNGKF